MHTRQPAFWKSRAYARRWRVVEPAPLEFTDYIRDFNAESARPTAARPAAAPADFVADVREALATLPPPVLALLGARFLGVYLARDLGCSAVADVVQHGGDVIGVAIVLDVDAFEHRDANQWAAWNEEATLQVEAPGAVVVTLADAADNHRKTALQFLLLHEIGHVLVAGRRFLPPWWIAPQALEPACRYGFLDLTWTIDAAQQIVPRQARDAALRDALAGCKSRPSTSDAARALYARLQHTSFPTLYALVNAYEDFSECLAVYAHTVLLGRPYRLALAGGADAPVVTDGQAIAARCARKFGFIEALLEGRSQGDGLDERPVGVLATSGPTAFLAPALLR